MVTTFRIGWVFIDPNTSPPPPLNITSVKKTLQNHLETHGTIDRYQVATDSLRVNREYFMYTQKNLFEILLCGGHWASS